MKKGTQVIKKSNGKILEGQNLLIAYSAESLTRKKYMEMGMKVDSFLGTYLKTGELEKFTRDYGIRDIMSKIKIDDIKKELFIMLYAQCHYVEPSLTQVFNKTGNNPNLILNHLFNDIKLDAKDYDKIFNHLIENYPEIFNEFIDKKLDSFFGNYYEKEAFINNDFDIENSRIDDGYLDVKCNCYDEELLKSIYEFKNPKKRLKVISSRKINEYTKSL